MLKILVLLIFAISPLSAYNCLSPSQERVVKNNEVEIWTETFGDPANPAILLIMGAGTSGIFFPDPFCDELAQNNYFVIRYDNRDVGKSSLIDYKMHPYSLEDMAQDSLAILDAYEIKKAHMIGLSMGGFITQILAIQHPERFLSQVCMMSSPDQSVMMAAITGKDTASFSLPPPPQEALDTWNAMKLVSIETKEDRIALNLKNWQLCAGMVGYNEEEFRDLEERNFERTKSFTAPFNHWPAMATWPSRLDALQNVKIPTLVIHGECDVVLPVEHGIAISHAIPGSKLVVIPTMGHALCEAFREEVISPLLKHLKADN